MAKLSTPYHQCSVRYVNEYGEPRGLCPYPAYRKFEGKWYCKTDLRRAKRRKGQDAK